MERQELFIKCLSNIELLRDSLHFPTWDSLGLKTKQNKTKNLYNYCFKKHDERQVKKLKDSNTLATIS